MKVFNYASRVQNKTSLGICLLLFTLALAIYINSNRSVLFTQDEMANYFGSISLMTKEDIFYSNASNLKYNTDLIGPSYITYTSKGQQIYNNFTGTFYINSLIISIFKGNHFLFNNLLGALCVVLIYIITTKLFNSKSASVIASIYAMLMPIFVVYTTSYFNTIFITFFFLSLILVILLRLNLFLKLILLSLFSSLLLLTRIDMLFSILPVFILIGFYYVYRIVRIYDWKNYLKFVLLITVLIPIIAFPFLVNYKFSGNYIDLHASSYAYIQEGSQKKYIKNYNASITDKLLAYFLHTPVGLEGFSFSKYLNSLSFNTNFIFSSTFAAPFYSLAFVLVLIYCLDRKQRNRKLVIIFLLVLLTTIITYCSNTSYTGFGVYNTRNALVRYFTPIIFMSSVFIGYLFYTMKNKEVLINSKPLLYGFISLLVSLNIIYLFNDTTYGVKLINTYRDGQYMDQKEIQTFVSLNREALFIADPYTEKYLVTENFEDLSKYNYLTYTKFDIYKETEFYPVIKNKLKNLIDNFHNDNRNVYLISKDSFNTDQVMKGALNNYVLALKKKDLSYYIYHIQPKKSL